MSLKDLYQNTQEVSKTSVATSTQTKTTGLSGLLSNSTIEQPTTTKAQPTGSGTPPLFSSTTPSTAVTTTTPAVIPKAQPSLFSKVLALPGKAIQGAGNLLEKTYGSNIEAGLASTPEDTLAESFLKKPASLVGGASPENLPFGVGDVVKEGKAFINDHNPDQPNVSFGDWLTGMKKAGQGFVGQVISGATELPNIATAGKYQPEIKFNFPGIGEITNSDYKIAQRVANGENPNAVVAEEKSTGFLNALFFIGLATKPFLSRPTVVGEPVTGESVPVRSGGEIKVTPAKSFRLFKAPEYTQPLAPEYVQKIAQERGITLPKEYDPKLPTFFKMTGEANGKITTQVIQIKPSYFKTFLNVFKSDVSKVPPEGTIKLLSTEVDTKQIAETKSQAPAVKPTALQEKYPAGSLKVPPPTAPTNLAKLAQDAGVVSPETPSPTVPAPISAPAENGQVTPPSSQIITQENPVQNGSTEPQPTPESPVVQPNIQAPVTQETPTPAVQATPVTVATITKQTAFTPERLQLAGVTPEEVVTIVNKAVKAGVDQAFLEDRGKYTATKIALQDIKDETAKMKTQVSAETANKKHYIQTYTGQGTKKAFVEVQGRPIQIVDGLDTFIHKNAEGLYVITEGRSGMSLAIGSKSRKIAIENAKEKVTSYAKSGGNIEDLIKSQVEKHGLSPRHAPPKKLFGQKNKVAEAVKSEPKSIKQIAEETKILEPNVRRILGVGAKDGTFARVDKGVYKLTVDGQDLAYIETGNALDILPRLAKDGFKSDMVFLDIPYKTSAIKGGNRGMNYNLISPEEFGKVLDSVKEIARTPDSPVIHMFSQAPSGMKEMQKYNDMFLEKGYKPVGRGELQKTFKTGLPVTNVRGLVSKPEGILVFNQSGKLAKDLTNLNFKLVRPKGYQSEKPAQMLKEMIEMTTNEGDVVLDPFAGSGVTGAEAVKAGRKAFLIEKNPEVAKNITKPRVENAIKGNETKIKDIYASVPKDKLEQATGELMTELELSQAGYRILTGTGADREVRGVPSTFPQWIPENLRSKELFGKIAEYIDPTSEKFGTFPDGNRPKQRELVQELLNEIDGKVGVDTKLLRDDIIKKYDTTTQKETARTNSGGSKGGEISADDFAKNFDETSQKVEVPATLPEPPPEKAPSSIQLNAGIDPGIGKTLSEDIIPKAKESYATAKAIFKEIATTFNPVGQAPREGVDILMKNKGDFERDIFRTEQATKKIKAMWDKQPESARLKFMAKVEDGTPITAENFNGFEDLAKMYRERLDNAHVAVSKYKNIPFLENFFPHFWEKPLAEKTSTFEANLGRVFAKRPLQGSKTFMKKRVFQSIQDGIDAGYKPVTTNPEELVQLYEANVKKFVMAQQIKEDMLAKKLWVKVKPGEQPPEDFAKIDDAIARIYYKETHTVKEFYDQIVMDKLNQVAKDLGITHERHIGYSKGLGGNRAGVSFQGGNLIKTKFASPESVLLHEIGHQIDYKYGLKSMIPDTPMYQDQLRALADLRIEGKTIGVDVSKNFAKSYIRNADEKMAVMFEAYLQAPEKFRAVAPQVYDAFVSFLHRHAELRPILDIKPSLVLGSNKAVIEGGMVSGGEYYAQKDVARLINNYLSKDRLMETSIGRGIMNVKNTLNAFQLGFSAFHLTMETLDTITTKLSVGLSEVASGNVIKGVKDILGSPLAPYNFFRTGQKFFNGDQTLAPIEKAIFEGGASFREKQYYKNNVLDNFVKNVRGGNYLGAIFRLPLASVEATMRPLFSYYIPRLKVGAFRDLYASELERLSKDIQAGKTTQLEVARNTWNNIENRMGELNYDNLFWNRNLKTALMLTFRAVGWNLGTIRELGGGLLQDTPREFAKLFTGKSKDFNFTPKMSYTLSLFILMGAIGAVYQYLHTGKKPEGVKDLYYPKNGAKDKSGEDYRVEFPSYLKDLYQFTHNPVKTVGNKTAPELSMLINLLTNKDFYGDYIRNTNDNLSTQAKQLGLFLGTQLLPFSVQNLNQLNAGTADTEQKIEAFFGIIKAPKEVIQSEYQKQLYQLYRDQAGEQGARTPEQKAVADLKAQAREAIKNGDMSILQQMIKDGIITPAGAKTFLKNAQKTTDERVFQMLKKSSKAELQKLLPPDNQPQAFAPLKALKSLFTPKTAFADTIANEKYYIRDNTITEQDLQEAKAIIFGEVSNRTPEKQKLEAQTILNTAFNRMDEYRKHGKDYTLTQVLQMPNQYQAYKAPLYTRYKSGDIQPGDKQKISAIDSALNDVRGGNFINNIGRDVSYTHLPDGRIQTNPKKLFK